LAESILPQESVLNDDASIESVLQVEEKSEIKQKDAEPKSSLCKVCNQEFSSRTKLFEHISKEGHAAAKVVEQSTSQPLSHNAMKKNKRLAKAKK
jgi:DnaJ homolog subfamily A member 5